MICVLQLFHTLGQQFSRQDYFALFSNQTNGLVYFVIFYNVGFFFNGSKEVFCYSNT